MVVSSNADFERLFKAYDIRGTYPDQLNENVATALGVAIAQFLRKDSNVVVGRDVRLSGEELRNGLVNGLVRGGCNVTDVGVVSTPMLFFATNRLNMNAGIMITASHNPPEWNGFKLFNQKACIYGEEMARIKNFAQMVDASKLGKAMGNAVMYEGIFQDYSDFVSTKIKVSKKLNVIADTANGVCGLFVPSLFEAQGCDILTLNEKPDGHFPAHLPEPKESTLGELKKRVVETKADFGVGYDGDGDRAVFVDDKGRTIPGDLSLMILAEDVLKRKKGAKIICELSCSLAVEEYVKGHGGVSITERVGHSFIMDRMVGEEAALGGEKSSHFYFSETNGGDDALFASLRMAEILSKRPEMLSEIFNSLPQYPSIYGENLPCPDELQSGVIERLKLKFKSEGRNFLDMDGIKLLDKSGWVLIRPSNTEPVIRITAEARTEERLHELHSFAKRELDRAIETCTDE